ncbi:hypothetical protein EMCG_08891 [[Emmonsia] crescens]|uniref:Uncharacterized protein n=1 Tax=[Emmonsia] crescens TaxID=73230 RepID=A0A0G2I4B4_9EURO|nr:hypothetical protein EMCG_08891 [Emmonsia crescens UAMH 3008]
MSFIQAALDTENVANTFSKFVAHVSEDAGNITGVVTELFTISASLRSLETLHNSPLRPNFSYIVNDIELVVRASLRHTIRVINEAFIAMDDGGRAQASQQKVRHTWFHLRDYFHREAGFPLTVRLRYYKQMLGEIILVVRNERGDQAALVNIRQTLTILRMAQDRQYAVDAQQRRQVNFTDNGRTFGPPPPTAPLGPSATFAPAANFAPTALFAPQVPPAPPPPPSGLRPHSNTPPLKSALRKPTPVSATPTQKRSYERQRPAGGRTASPHAPGWFEVESPTSSLEVPDSPSTTDSTSTDSFSFLDPIDHWAVGLFSSPTTATPLPRSSKGSKCHGDFDMPDALARLEKDYDELFRLNFKPNLTAILYLRESDHRARILCQVHRSSSKTIYATLPLNVLTLSRQDSHLLLCTKSSKEQGLRAWLSLQFETIEKMVLFNCAFIALRGQDSGRPISKTPDAFALGEKEIYGGRIVDDNYLHALRIFQDRPSGAIRLQASVHSGEMEDVPVWTAFIHHFVGLKAWMRRADRKTIILSDLDRAIFIDSEQYTPRITRRLEHVLTFANEIG